MVRLASITDSDSEDPVLQELLEQLGPADARDTEWRGDGETPPNPFELEVATPGARDVRTLYRLAKASLPAEIQAALGPRKPVLLVHTLTPFARPGTTPHGLWGLGYSAEPEGVEAITVSLVPTSEVRELGSADLDLQVGLAADGGLAVPPEVLKAAAAVPGLTIGTAQVHATANAQFALALHLRLSAIRIQAGPIGAGGARWNIYKGGDRLEVSHQLLHTLLVPEDTRRLTIGVKAWLTTAYRYFLWSRTRTWEYPAQRFEMSLVGGEGTPGA